MSDAPAPGPVARPAGGIGRVIARNLGFNVFTLVTLRLGNLLLVPVQTRWLGPEGYGVLQYGVAYAAMWALVAGLGLDKSLVKDVARDRERSGRLVATALGLFGGATALLLPAALGALSWLAPDPAAARVAGAITVASFLAVGAGIYKAGFEGLERMEYNTGLALLNKLLGIALAVSVLVLAGAGVEAYALALLALAAVQFLLTAGLARRVAGGALAWPGQGEAREHLAAGLPFLAGTLLGGTMSHVDTLMIQAQLDAVQVAHYQAALKLVLALVALPAALTAATYPTLSRLVAKDRPRALALVTGHVRLLAVLAIPVVAVLAGDAPRVVELLFGEAFLPAAPLVVGLSGATLLGFTYFPLGLLLGSSGHQPDNVRVAALAGVANLAGNLLWIPDHGAAGAVGATLLAHLTTLAGSLLYVRRRFPDARPLSSAPGVIATAAATGLVVWGSSGLPLPGRVLAALCAWALAAWATGALRGSDLAWARRGAAEPDGQGG